MIVGSVSFGWGVEGAHSRAEQSGAGQMRGEEGRADQSRIEQSKAG